MGASESTITKADFNSLNNQIISLNGKLDAANFRITVLEGDINILASKSDVKTQLDRLEVERKNQTDLLSKFEAKLAKVKLPAETRLFLDENELSNLRNKIRTINAQIARLHKIEKSLLSIAVQLQNL